MGRDTTIEGGAEVAAEDRLVYLVVLLHDGALEILPFSFQELNLMRCMQYFTNCTYRRYRAVLVQIIYGPLRCRP